MPHPEFALGAQELRHRPELAVHGRGGSAMLQRHEHLSAADAAWLRMDAPANRMIITALLTFDGRLDPIAFEHTLHRLAELPRFKARVVPTRNPFGLPELEDDPRFDLRAHVHHVALPSDPPPACDARSVW